MVFHVLLSLLFGAQAVTPGAQLIPWEQTIRWNIDVNADTGPWESTILDSDGHERFRVALVPLWAVEGGVTAFEIVLATAENPQVNLLGERQLNGPQAIVIDVQDLKRGIARSKFGRRRSFSVPMTRDSQLEVTVLGARLGKGAGMCNRCPNVQELRATVAVRTR